MPINIGNTTVGDGHPVYLIAELSANHNQDYEQAIKLIHAAKEAGADAVKLQTYTPDTLTIDCDNEHFRIGPGTSWAGRTLYNLYSEAYTPWDWQPGLKQAAEDLGMELFSTPFDSTAVDFLEKMGVQAYKVASFEIVDVHLIARIAATGKPIIMSTGMATLAEIEEAVATARAAGATEIALLKCTSAYPAPAEEANLRTIPYLREKFRVPVGLSDHTLSPAVPVAAVSLGACIVEKHLTLSRSAPGPDSSFSLEPHEFKAMAEAIRVAEMALGEISLSPTEKEEASRVFRRSLFVVQDVRAGEVLTSDNVRTIRPGDGLHPRYLDIVMRQRAAKDISLGTPLAWDLIDGGEALAAQPFNFRSNGSDSSDQ